MPLLNKSPFTPKEPPPDLTDDEEVFFCRLTGEIFRDYEQFCDRIILCNSLVWSCSLTGRSSLTYQEAAASEEKIKRLLKRFPMELRIPVLYLASLCERKSLLELAEDVFTFVKDRFFIGETVLVSLKGGSKGDKPEQVECHVLAVNPPTQDEIEKYEETHPRNGDRFRWTPAALYTYDVEKMESGEELQVRGDQISRKRSAYNKDKNRLYIKQFVHQDNGVWKLKESSNTKYGISKVKFSQIFCGEPPRMTNDKLDAKARKRQETINKYFKPSTKKVGLSPRKSPRKSGDILERRGPSVIKRKRRTKKEIEEAKRLGIKKSRSPRSVELKQKQREETRLKKKGFAEFYKEWNMKRDDLECEDLKELPVPTEVSCRLPNHLVGDAIMLLEFFHSFRNLLPVKDFFPHGLTFDLVERALVDQEIAGPLADILQLLLSSIFELQEQEFDEIKETDVKITPGLIFTRGGPDIMRVVKAATASEALARRYHSGPISQLAIDSTTVSEILRLHLLTSGAVPGRSKVAKWRYQARGGYCNNDDPAVFFKLKKPHLIEKLGQCNIFDFSTEEKLAVVNCLVEQLITYSSFRDLVEEGCEKARLTRIELRAVRAAEVRKEKEEAIRLKAEKKAGNLKNIPSSTLEDKNLVSDKKENRELRNCDKKADETRLLGEIRQALAGAQLMPLGSDRAHRRYWIFSSVPGLFVEEGEDNPGPCIPNGTPFFPSPPNDCKEEEHLNYIRKLFEKSSKDKENIPGGGRGPGGGVPPTALHSPSKRQLLAEKNGSPLASPAKEKEGGGGGEEAVGDVETPRGGGGLTCNGGGGSGKCPVHGRTPSEQHRWSVFSSPGHLEQLIAGLNRRGHRERRLRQALTQEKATILERLNSCPADKYNVFTSTSNSRAFTELQNKSTKAYDQSSSFGFPKETPLDEVLEANLRDLILEVEDKIFLGVIGGIKVKDREAWREAIRNFSYDRQCKTLTWGSKGSDDNADEIKEEPLDEEVKKEEAEEGSRASTPSLEGELAGSSSSGAVWLGVQQQGCVQRPVILDLASAILQLGQAIEFKYLKRPLGLDPKEREDKKICLIEPKFPTVAMGRWEEGLMSSTNLPQLFLYLSALDNSVAWERSALHASCKICRRKKDPESMLLCDTCNKGYHLYCLKPKLTKVPPGDWHCPVCQPRVKALLAPKKKKKRRLFSEGSDQEEEEEEQPNDCNSCGERGAQLSCGTCEVWLHLDCVNPPMRRVPKSKWFCHDCRNAQASSSSSSNTRKSEIDIKEESEEVKMETGEDAAEDEEEEIPNLPPPSARSSNGKGGRQSSAKEESRRKERKTASPRINGHTNGYKYEAEEEELAEERASRRRCSKAATAKISHFAKQLRNTKWDGESDEEEEEGEGGDGASAANGHYRPNRDRRSTSSRRSEGKSRVRGRELPLDNAALQEILDVLMHDPDAPPFLRPVTRAEAPDYHEIVKKPMDLGTIKHKLNMLSYQKNADLIADAELLFNNCYLYNDERTQIYKAGEKLRKLFYKLCLEHNLLDSSTTVETEAAAPPAKRLKAEEIE